MKALTSPPAPPPPRATLIAPDVLVYCLGTTAALVSKVFHLKYQLPLISAQQDYKHERHPVDKGSSHVIRACDIRLADWGD